MIKKIILLALLVLNLHYTSAQENSYPSAIKKGMSNTELSTLRAKIYATLGKYPTMFEEYRNESERKVKLVRWRVESSNNRLELYFDEGLQQIGIREERIELWTQMIKDTLTHYLELDFNGVDVALLANNQPIETFVPNAYRTKIAQDEKRKSEPYNGIPLTRHSNSEVYGKGLDMRHIALWASHGYYYETRDKDEPKWKFQRPALFTSIEDLNTFDYTYSYLIPMLENAGAIVISPRERSPQTIEIIADNDASHPYAEVNQISGDWKPQQGGFVIIDTLYEENPFELGTYLTAQGDAQIEYTFERLPKADKYPVWVSYKALSTNQSRVYYSIEHKHGVSQVEVNQRMMGSTWVYLGEWEFETSAKVTLKGGSEGKATLTSDAVRLGSGMGNVSRGGSISGMPRWIEAARYNMQYSGVPKDIYRVGEKEEKEKTPKKTTLGGLDYVDDYKSRGNWVNWLNETQNVPVDLAMGLHTNAGMNDTIFGTLTIHYTNNGKAKLRDGATKFVSQELSDMVLTQITDDMKQLYSPQWTRRSLYDKSYAEISRPLVPAILVEMFSHQDSTDMAYATTPQVKFDMSRAIYKGILKFLAARYSMDYAVQPLAVHNFRMQMVDDTKIRLRWNSTTDILEPTAEPTHYILYTQIGENGKIDEGKIIRRNSEDIEIIADGKIRKYWIVAANQGGRSFRSEILSCGFSKEYQGRDEVETVENISQELSSQVPYIHNYGYVGAIYDWDNTSEFKDNDNPGFGASYKDFVGIGTEGEKFDNTTKQGKEILLEGGSYISIGGIK